jgi:membrane-bound lytic murein transglycosylase MltF
VILMTRANWNRLDKLVADNDGKLAMTDAAYNGGIGGVLNERRACGLREGCDPNKWFGHVEKVCLKSTKPLYAGRSACDINRHHVHDVLHTRMPKYKGKI